MSEAAFQISNAVGLDGLPVFASMPEGCSRHYAVTG